MQFGVFNTKTYKHTVNGCSCVYMNRPMYDGLCTCGTYHVHKHMLHMRTCKHANMQTCKHANMQTCKHANMQTCTRVTHAYMHTCTHVHMHTCTHAHMQTCKHTRARHTCMHTYNTTHKGCHTESAFCPMNY